MKNNKKFVFRKIVLIFLAIFLALFIIASFFLNVDFPAEENDLFLYRISLLLFFIPLEIGLLSELNIFGISKIFPFVKSNRLSKHLLFWVIIFFAAVILFAVPYSRTSENFKNRLNTANNASSSENIFFDEKDKTEKDTLQNKTTQKAESHREENKTDNKDITEKDEHQNETTQKAESHREENKTDNYVTKDKPLTLTFSDNEAVVGNCTVILTKIEFVQEPFKASNYSKFIRVHATIKNNSSQKTKLDAHKANGVFIGQYYGTKTKTNIGFNNNHNWKDKNNVPTDIAFTLNPYETKNVCITGVFVDDSQLEYSTVPKMDLYFANNNETLTIPVNKQ